MVSNSIQLPQSWLKHLEEEFSKPYMLSLKKKLIECKKSNKIVYPEGSLIFNAFQQTYFENVKVVKRRRVDNNKRYRDTRDKTEADRRNFPGTNINKELERNVEAYRDKFK